MANRRDSLPKNFREVPCARCGVGFKSTGPNHKRCDPCRAEHKREYERTNKRAKRSRRSSCSRCSAPFPPDVSAHQRYCAPCAVKVRNDASAAAYAANVEKARAIGRRSYHKHKEKILAARKEIKPQLAAIMRKRREDPGSRLHCNISRVVSMSLNGQKAGRKWESLVGYTVDELRRHLERQFVKGMTWKNYGSRWHVDHVIPRAEFTFQTAGDPDFKACWALSNLQPLWSLDNLKKSAKRIHLL